MVLARAALVVKQWKKDGMMLQKPMVSISWLGRTVYPFFLANISDSDTVKAKLRDKMKCFSLIMALYKLGVNRMITQLLSHQESFN